MRIIAFIEDEEIIKKILIIHPKEFDSEE